MIIMGIDPGQQTGIALFDGGKLTYLKTCHPAEMPELIKAANAGAVIFEDSRLHRHAWNARSKVAIGAAIQTGRCLGQVDAWCILITHACAAMGIPAYGISPKNKGAKLNAEQFKAATGWATRSNQHERDAAMVAWPKRAMRIGRAN